MKTIGPDPRLRDTARNPFEPPRARVADPGPEGTGQLLTLPRTVGAGRGFAWLGEGWELFREAPGTWIGIAVVWGVISIALNLIPLANLLSNLLNPVLAGGVMLGCHSLACRRELTLGHLFEGFQRNFGPLLLVGLLSLAATVAILVLVFLGILGMGGLAVLLQQDTAAAPDPLLILLAVLVALALLLPLMMAVWFAPALVALHDMPALKAMTLSFQGCLRNLLPFLTYGLGGLGLAILASIPLFLGWLVLMPVLIASTYAAYRDIFVD